jgi:hypothetical protein
MRLVFAGPRVKVGRRLGRQLFPGVQHTLAVAVKAQQGYRFFLFFIFLLPYTHNSNLNLGFKFESHSSKIQINSNKLQSSHTGIYSS